MLSTFLLAILVVAALLAAGASRLRLSPWWVFFVAVVAGFIAVVTSSDVASCNSADSVEAVFGFASLIALGLFATAAFTALFDAVSLARRGESALAAWRLAPLLLSVAAGFGTLALWIFTVVSCLN
jgi:hypothetical protein